MSTFNSLTKKATVALDPKNLTWVRPMNNVTSILRRLRARAGFSQAYMAKRLKLARQSSYRHYEDATRYEKKFISPEIVEKLAKILVGQGKPPIAKSEVWALAGELLLHTKESGEDIEHNLDAGEVAPKIPILQWGQVMAYISKTLDHHEIEKYTDASHDDPGTDAFVLPIRDSSMTGGENRMFPGDKVVCDPSKPYEYGDIVIADIDNEPEAIIGHYTQKTQPDGERVVEIKPSNDAWPSHIIDKENPGSILGPVIELRKALGKRKN